MVALWRTRLRQHVQEQQKYLRLVFNDHFVLVLLILFGGALYAYSLLVKTLQPSWWLALCLAVIFTALIALGQLATLAQAPDQVFLLPKAEAFSDYLLKARRYSMILPATLLGFAALAMWPLFAQLGQDPISGLLNFEALIDLEADRMGRLYRFYNLFTDVPGLANSVHRRRYLDPLLKLVKPSKSETWAYLYLRGFLRVGEYLGLYLRLLVIGAIIVAVLSQWWLLLGFAILFLYMVGFQLLPFFFQYDEIVFTHLYPVAPNQKLAAFERLLMTLLLLEVVVFTLVALIRLQWLAASGASRDGMHAFG